MAFGPGGYGIIEPWGSVGGEYPTPTLVSVSPLDPDAERVIADRDGGTLLAATGTGFYAPIYFEVLRAGSPVTDLYGKEARGFVWDPEGDMTEFTCHVGLPSLPDGLYDLRAVTPGGTTGILSGVIEYRLHAEEYRVVEARSKFGSAWRTGVRFLRR